MATYSSDQCTVIQEFKNRGVSLKGVKKLLLHILTEMDVLNQSLAKTKTGTSRIIDQAQSLLQVAGHARCSSILNAQKDKHQCDGDKGHIIRDEFPKFRSLLQYDPVGGLRTSDGRSCQAFDVDSYPNVSGQDRKDVRRSPKGWRFQLGRQYKVIFTSEAKTSATYNIFWTGLA